MEECFGLLDIEPPDLFFCSIALLANGELTSQIATNNIATQLG